MSDLFFSLFFSSFVWGGGGAFFSFLNYYFHFFTFLAQMVKQSESYPECRMSSVSV